MLPDRQGPVPSPAPPRPARQEDAGVPVCSIVIPVYNWASVTRQCLETLFADPPEVEIEVIVVDDGSHDRTAQVLAEYGPRVRIVTHAQNLGFATACNDGAAIARGEYLVFLNNDTLPTRGWLDALVAYARSHPHVAVVGGKILNADGTIQHAGIAISQDRFARHIYRGFPADHPAVNRSRRFQAVNGACMLVRRAIFETIGGFDQTYRNCYEDMDLCFRLGALGHEIHYCHTSEVIHLEMVTRAGRIPDFGAATALYRQRWAHRLVPDDLDYFVRDGLLRLRYEESSIQMTISPLLAAIDDEDRAWRADGILAERARQVSQLLSENARLQALLLEAEARANDLAQAQRAPGQGSGRSTEPLADDRHHRFDPPAELVRLVGGDFEAIGAEFAQLFLTIGALQPHESVLEVGCGVGRMAVPLTRILGPAGRYAGFDVMKDAIEWCRQEITPRYPRFHFDHADAVNSFYNPDGSVQPSEYRFPHDDESFDFVFLTSVFTHMLPADVEQYASEIARVLKKGGRCFITFFLLNDESRALIRSGMAGPFPFNTLSDIHTMLYPHVPEAAVAYDETYARQLLRRHNLTIAEPIHYGDWCGRLDGLSLQDIVLAVKDAGGRSAVE